jgi:hypothetical protein
MITLIERVAATNVVVKKLAGKPLVWGKTDCARLVAVALRELGKAPPLRDAGVYKSYLGAHKSLRKMGHETLQDWVDTWGLRPIIPAFILPADVVALPSDDPKMPCLALVLTNNRFFTYIPETGVATEFQLSKKDCIIKAWSVG